MADEKLTVEQELRWQCIVQASITMNPASAEQIIDRASLFEKFIMGESPKAGKDAK